MPNDTASNWLDGNPLPIQKTVLERDIQASCVRFSRDDGAYCRKFSSPGNRSVPDYIMLHRGVTLYVEFKVPGKTLTKLQAEERDQIVAAGGEHWVIDNVDVFKRTWRERFGR